MTDDRFDELMRDAAQTFNRPPEAPLDEMWDVVERTAWNAAPVTTAETRTSRSSLRAPGWAIAATLIVGIGLGRVSVIFNRTSSTQPTAQAPSPVTTVASVRTDSSAAEPYEAETSKYLGQTAALLIALPSEMRAGRDDQFVARAGELLTRTRLLLDSPAAADPGMRSLLDDLELVLAQIVRLQNNHTSRTELDLINRALEQRDVIPRLRSAVADNSAN
jgi:hypothetical protein